MIATDTVAPVADDLELLGLDEDDTELEDDEHGGQPSATPASWIRLEQHNVAGSGHTYGLVISPDGRERLAEAVGQSTGPYTAFRFQFVDCLTGQAFTVEGHDDDGMQRWHFKPVTRDTLLARSGLTDPDFRNPGYNWTGGWFTKRLRNPIMRGLVDALQDETIACGHRELAAILDVREPMPWRINDIMEFASRVADRVDSGQQAGVQEAIAAQHEQDMRMLLFARFARRRPDRSWEIPPTDVDTARLAQAAGWPRLADLATAAIHAATAAIAAEITDARMNAAGGQSALF